MQKSDFRVKMEPTSGAQGQEKRKWKQIYIKKFNLNVRLKKKKAFLFTESMEQVFKLWSFHPSRL